MNIASLIQGFENYLDNLGKISNKQYNTDSANVSIFMYSQEFKNYLRDELGSSNEIASMNVDDILKMNIVNGQLLDGNGQNIENNPAGINDILNNLFSDKSVIDTLDKDSDGILNQDEINNFLEAIKSYDTNSKNISLDDILSAAQAIQDGTFKLNENAESTATQGLTTPENTSNNVNSTESSSKKHHSSSSKDYDSSPEEVKQKDINNMTKEELTNELNTANTTLQEKQNVLEAILNGSDSSVKALQDNVNTTYEAYQEQLKTLDSDLAAKLDAKVKDITAKEQEISQTEFSISQQEATVSSCETAYNNAVSEVENLNTCKSELENTDTSNMSEEQKAELRNKINAVSKQISEAEAERDRKKQEWEDAQTQLDNLNKTKSEQETALNNLNSEKAEIDAEISKLETTNPELKTARENYEQAKTALTEGKQTAAAEAKSGVKEAQDYVNKIENALQNKNNEENKSNYSLEPEYNAEIGTQLAKLGSEIAKDMDTIGNCLVGVGRTIRKFLGGGRTALTPLPKAYLAAEQFRNDPTLSKHFKEVKVDRSDLDKLPAGAVVVWNKSEGHPAGHISIALGNGKEASDHIQKQMNRKNADFTVFYPV